MLFNRLYTKLFDNEPDATGGSSTGSDTQNTETKTEGKDDTASDPFLNALEGSDEEPEETEDGEGDGHGDDVPEADEFDWEGIQYNDDDKKLITELAEKHNISKRALSPFLRDVQSAVAEAEKKQIAEAREKANAELQKKWGANYKTNVKKVGAFIQNLGKTVGWNDEIIKSFSNPQSFSLFYDIMRSTGESKLRGANQQVPEKTGPKDLESCRKEIHETEEMWFAAKKDGNHTRMKEMSDKHVELMTMQKKFMGTYKGKEAPRLLGY